MPIITYKKGLNFILPLLQVVIGALFVIFIWHLMLFCLLGYQEDSNAQLSELIRYKKNEINHFMDHQKSIAHDEMQLRFIANLRDQNLRTAQSIRVLTKLTPDTIRITHLEQSGNQVVMQGDLSSEIQLVKWMDDIAKSTFFNQPVLTGLTSGTGQIRTLHFNVTLGIHE